MDVANVLTQVPGIFAGKLANGTLGSFAGVKSSKNLNTLNDLGHAQMLEAQKVPSDAILSKTGWFRGLDKRWRYEIDDSKATFKPEWYNQPAPLSKIQELANKEKAGTLTDADRFKQEPFDPNVGKTRTTLGKVLDHPELYKAYPELKDIPVVRDNEVPTAHWNPTLKEIKVGPEIYNTKMLCFMKSSMLFKI